MQASERTGVEDMAVERKDLNESAGTGSSRRTRPSLILCAYRTLFDTQRWPSSLSKSSERDEERPSPNSGSLRHHSEVVGFEDVLFSFPPTPTIPRYPLHHSMLRTKRSHSPAPSIASTSSSRSADSPPPRKRVFRSSDTDTDLPPAAPNAFLAPHSSTSSSHKRSAVDLDLSDASDSSEDVLEGAPARVSRPPPKRIRRNLSDSFDRLGFRDQDGEIMGDPCDLEQGMAPSAVELPASEIEEGDLRGVWVGHAPPDEALGRDGMRFELLDEDDEAGAGGPGRGALQLERWQGARPLREPQPSPHPTCTTRQMLMISSRSTTTAFGGFLLDAIVPFWSQARHFVRQRPQSSSALEGAAKGHRVSLKSRLHASI